MQKQCVKLFTNEFTLNETIQTQCRIKLCLWCSGTVRKMTPPSDFPLALSLFLFLARRIFRAVLHSFWRSTPAPCPVTSRQIRLLYPLLYICSVYKLHLQNAGLFLAHIVLRNISDTQVLLFRSHDSRLWRTKIVIIVT